MSTFIHGIGASEVIDSAGEVVSISGMDISSLAKDGVFNWEHKKDLPGQTVGKVLKAKKIFSIEDCEDEHQRYFWEKVQCPYVYVMGELLDDYTESARDCAGQFRYDADRKGKQDAIVSFSIEGATIEKPKGSNIVTRSIARKVTITNMACNKTAGAEMVVADDGVHDLFKTENPGILVLRVEPPKKHAVEMLKHAESLGIPMQKNEPMKPKTTTAGMSIGATSSGKPVMSHAKIHEYHRFTSKDHHDAAELHQQAATQAHHDKNVALMDHHMQKKKMHIQAAGTALKRETRFSRGAAAKQAKRNAVLGKAMGADSPLTKEHLDRKIQKADAPPPPPPPPPPSLGQTATMGGTSTINAAIGNPFGKSDQVNKPLFEKVPGHKTTPGQKAGMGMSHMGQKVRHGAASETVYSAKEIAHKNLKRIRATKPNLTKAETSEWLERAEQAYALWPKREIFEKFMEMRMPHLAKGEVIAIGQTLALKKSVEAEAQLEKLEKALKFGIEADQKAVARMNEEAAKKPKAAYSPKKKAPSIDKPMDGEVSHTSSYGSDHEIVHLKSGHEVHGAQKGKFKAGDKVHVKPHLMGTVLIDHKK